MLNLITEALKKAGNILILTHLNPDGDALGSTAGFKLMLEKMGKKATILLEKEPAPMFSVFGDNFSWGEAKEDFDLVVALDCGDKKRLGECEEYFKGNTISIDHHISNSRFADINYVVPDASATGEIVYEFIKHSGVEFTPEMATVLYGAILTDTGGFMFSNTTKKTHLIAGELIGLGADYYTLNKKLIQEKDYKRHLVSAYAIENAEFEADGKICICLFDNELCNKLQMDDEDLAGLAQVTRSITGVEVGVLITEISEGIIKVSLRSDELCNVSQVAEAFGGGGHIRASGVRFREKLPSEVKELIVKEIMKQL